MLHKSSECLAYLQNIGQIFRISCKSLECRANIQNFGQIFRMSDKSSECRANLENVGQSSECQANLQNVRQIFRMLGQILRVLDKSSEYRADLQNVGQIFRMSDKSSECRANLHNVGCRFINFFYLTILVVGGKSSPVYHQTAVIHSQNQREHDLLLELNGLTALEFCCQEGYVFFCFPSDCLQSPQERGQF